MGEGKSNKNPLKITTVQPLYSGHRRGMNFCPLQSISRLQLGLSKVAFIKAGVPLHKGCPL